MRRFLALAPLILGLAACTGARKAALDAPDGFPNHTAEQIVAHLPVPDSLWRSFTGDLSVAYSMPGDRGTLNARIAYRRADSVLIRFRAPLGIEVSRALVTQDSMFVYDRLEKKLYYGLRGVAERMLPIGFWRSDIAAAVFGYDDLSGERWTVSLDNEYYVLRNPDNSRQVIVDPKRWRIIAADRRDATGTVIEQRRFTDFERTEGRYLPRRIVTSRSNEEVRASISIRRIRPDPEELSFDLGLRTDVQRIPVY